LQNPHNGTNTKAFGPSVTMLQRVGSSQGLQ